MSQFDPQTFLTETVANEASETSYPTIPPGEYPATVTKVEARETPKKDEDGAWTIVDVTFQIEDENVKEVTGLDKPSVRTSVFLDMEDGKLATGTGKNVQLGRLREALECNEGEFSFQQFMGRSALILVALRPDKDDPEIVYNDIKKVGKLV